MEQTTDAVTGVRLGQQLRTGYTAVKDQVAATAQTMKEELKASARVAGEDVGTLAAAGADRARVMAGDTMTRVKETTYQALDGARSRVRTSPEKWLLIAMGAGVLAGACAVWMTSGGQRSQNGRRAEY